MPIERDDLMRRQLLALLRGGNAHMPFDAAVADFPMAHINTPAPNVPYRPWHLLEHIRIAQWDILEFIRDPSHDSPDWPEGYWPARDATTDAAGWQANIDAFHADMAALEDIVTDPATDLLTPIAHAPDYTIFREIMLVAEHNAYHVGEFAILRQVMETWPADR